MLFQQLGQHSSAQFLSHRNWGGGRQQTNAGRAVAIQNTADNQSGVMDHPYQPRVEPWSLLGARQRGFASLPGTCCATVPSLTFLAHAGTSTDCCVGKAIVIRAPRVVRLVTQTSGAPATGQRQDGAIQNTCTVAGSATTSARMPRSGLVHRASAARGRDLADVVAPALRQSCDAEAPAHDAQHVTSLCAPVLCWEVCISAVFAWSAMAVAGEVLCSVRTRLILGLASVRLF
jgi:hypothetical protein